MRSLRELVTVYAERGQYVTGNDSGKAAERVFLRKHESGDLPDTLCEGRLSDGALAGGKAPVGKNRWDHE